MSRCQNSKWRSAVDQIVARRGEPGRSHRQTVDLWPMGKLQHNTPGHSTLVTWLSGARRGRRTREATLLLRRAPTEHRRRSPVHQTGEWKLQRRYASSIARNRPRRDTGRPQPRNPSHRERPFPASTRCPLHRARPPHVQHHGVPHRTCPAPLRHGRSRRHRPRPARLATRPSPGAHFFVSRHCPSRFAFRQLRPRRCPGSLTLARQKRNILAPIRHAFRRPPRHPCREGGDPPT